MPPSDINFLKYPHHCFPFHQAYAVDGIFVTTVDGVNITSYWNLGSANYNGLNCPYILREEDPDQPSYYLNWQVARATSIGKVGLRRKVEMCELNVCHPPSAARMQVSGP